MRRAAGASRRDALALPHMFGRVADPGPFLELGAPVIEDCAQALGATLAGRPSGSFGLAAVASFYATKVIATAEGGLVATSSAPLADRVRDLKGYDRRPLDRRRYNLRFTTSRPPSAAPNCAG